LTLNGDGTSIHCAHDVPGADRERKSYSRQEETGMLATACH